MISRASCASTWRLSRLPPDRERKIVEEWAAQLEEVYDALVAEGLSDDEAWSEMQRQIPDWAALGDELLDAEPVIARLAQPTRAARRRRGSARAGDAAARELTSGLAGDLHAEHEAARQGSRLHRDGHSDARHLPRRQRRHLHRRPLGAVAAACPCPMPIASSASAMSTRRSRPTTSCPTTCPPTSTGSKR